MSLNLTQNADGALNLNRGKKRVWLYDKPTYYKPKLLFSTFSSSKTGTTVTITITPLVLHLDTADAENPAILHYLISKGETDCDIATT